MAREQASRADRMLTAALATANGLLARCDGSELLAEQAAGARAVIANRTGAAGVQTLTLTGATANLVLAAREVGFPLEPAEVTLAVRFFATELERRHPGHTLELRIPPLVAAQLAALSSGPAHTRGTPPNVAETDADTWLDLVCGRLSWDAAMASARLRASGAHVTDLAEMIADLHR